jgi:hypothetical protein
VRKGGREKRGLSHSMVDCRSPLLCNLKMRNLGMPRSVTKMLAGLMSRWTIPLACAASSTSAISIFANVVNRADVRVIQRRGSFCFPPKASQSQRISRKLLW